MVNSYVQSIHNRVNGFLTALIAQFPAKRGKNKLIKHILSSISVPVVNSEPLAVHNE